MMDVRPSTVALLAIVAVIVYFLLSIGRRDPRLPPGPPTIPLLGNLHQVPPFGAHFKFTKWAKKYGGIFSLKLGPGTAIVVSDRRLVRELLDKQSAISSYRPTSYLAQKLITGGDHLLVMDYGPRWRSMRKLVVQEFNETVCEKRYIGLINAEANQMLHDMVFEPSGYMHHPGRFSNSIIMSLVFGTRTPSIETPHMKRLYELMEHWSKVLEIGATPPVDFYPFLKWVPERFLGNWVSRATQVKNEMDSLYRDLVEDVVKRRDAIGPRASLTDKLLENQEKYQLDPHQLHFLSGVVLEGGSDTTAASLLAFIKVMTCHPEVQRKAQAQIDAVIGEDRSPQWSDYDKLPYIMQVVKESMRYRPIGGLGVPHAISEDTWLEGMFLPRGSMVMWNLWRMHLDDKYVTNPEIFDPDRFEGRTLLAPEYAASNDYAARDHYNYGVGRRLCPGIHLAERNMFIGIAKLLWAFNFEKQVDENGAVIEPDMDYGTGYSEGFIVCTKDFPAKITPRSEKSVDTITREFKQAEVEVFPQYV